MHPFFMFLGSEKANVTAIDAIPKRTTVLDENILVDRCSDLFSRKGCEVVALTVDGLVQWHITNCNELLGLYRKAHITTVLSIPHEVLGKIVPDRW